MTELDVAAAARDVRPPAAYLRSARHPHITLLARDLASTARWWCETLGFQRLPGSRRGQPEVDAEPRRLMVRHPESGLVIGFQPRAGMLGGPAGSEVSQLSLRVDSEQALDNWARHLSLLGVPHSPVRHRGDAQVLSLAGPDGVDIELWWPVPR